MKSQDLPLEREATHAGSWYEGQEQLLKEQIQDWIDQTSNVEPSKSLKAIIGPHAGYRFCGHVQAHGYCYIDPKLYNRVFLLGPSHHFYSKKCHITKTNIYKTPLGDLKINQQVRSELMETNQFEELEIQEDEDEHSLELHIPYIKYIFRDQNITLLPIIVGAVSTESEKKYGEILSKYLKDPKTIFIVSSDFCHWGRRFRYTPHDQAMGKIHQYIDWLDHEGMKAIESGDPPKFTKYMDETQNTICGQHPIAVLLNALEMSEQKYNIEFKFYDQSSKCQHNQDSSVSYAAALVEQISQT